MIFNMRFHQFFSLFTFFSFFTIQATEQSLHVFQLPRVQVVQQASLEQQEQEIFKRKVSKYAVTAGIAATAVIVLFVAYEIREAARQSRNSETIMVNKADLQLAAASKKSDSATFLTPVWWITSNIKSFVRDSSEFLANSATILASGAVLNGASNVMQQKLSAVHQDETVLWYIAQHTQINQILSDLKCNAVEYDLYATLLCAQDLNQDAQTHMRAFIKDVIQTTKDQNTIKNSFSDDNYFDFLLGEVKKKYMRQAGEIEALQEYAAPIVAKRQRAQ
ncbi:MAG TPA: hypothetical protein VLG50_00010, partial [Candidatus Saccharimonadales bacterium]|nr:hypothetical protein [Candidatus Saccharimonadales bacterium]